MDAATKVALIAVVVAFIANVITLLVGVGAHFAEDRRARWVESWRQTSERRERLRPQFERALRGSFMLQALSGLQHYKAPSKLSADERKAYGDALDNVYADLQIADVALRLEGQIAAIDELTALATWFRTFRTSLSLMEDGGAKFLEQADAAAKQVKAKAEALEELLRQVLAELNPPGPEPPEVQTMRSFAGALASWWAS